MENTPSPTLVGSSSHEKARKLRALLLSGGDVVFYNFGRVLGAVKDSHPVSCGCDDGCEVFIVLHDCLHKQGQFVSAVQSCELSKKLDLSHVFLKWSRRAVVPLRPEREGRWCALLRVFVSNVVPILADCR